MDAPQTLPPKAASGKIVVLIVVVAIAAGAALFGSLFLFIFSLMKSNGAYQGAVDRAHKSAEVVQALGEPLSEGFFVTGSINTSNSTGSANLTIPISGPKGGGSLHVVAQMDSDVWTFSELRLNVHGGSTINLAAQHGVVKSYNKQKGYGFITPGDGGQDIFVQQSEIMQQGEPTLEPGQNVDFEIQQDEKGPKAIHVHPK